MLIDARTLPFSRYGSYMAFSMLSEENTEALYLREIGGGDEEESRLLKISPIDARGQACSAEVEADETELRISSPAASGRIRICFPEADRLFIRSERMTFECNFIIGKYDHLNAIGTDEWEFHSCPRDVKLHIKRQTGECSAHKENMLRFGGQVVEIIISRYLCVPQKTWKPESFESEVAKLSRNYERWQKALPQCPDRYKSSLELASYITWSAVVHPSGLLSRPAMYMSKNWMTNIWSWDNCFNALGLASHQPELAYDQFILFADLQDESGVLPDFANNRYSAFACCKPPVHGWTYLRLMENSPFFEEHDRLSAAYAMLKAMESYWRIHRMYGHWPLPCYNHGNDSGWDNATVFTEGCPVSSPDLPAYMILLYEALETMARRLNLEKEAEEWSKRRFSMLSNMINTLWDGKRFRSWNPLLKRPVLAEHSLIDWMPILVAKHLPAEIRSHLITHLVSSSLRTAYGLATEAVDSPRYRSDGYWQGPIWAPVTLLIADGLRRCGEEKAAVNLARDFCDMTLIGGMAENFDAQSGRGQGDPAFTWTSNVFLYFIEHYLKGSSG